MWKKIENWKKKLRFCDSLKDKPDLQMKIMLRFIPKRALLVALIMTALIGGVYYAWNPPNKRPQSHNPVKTEDLVEPEQLKAQIKPKALEAELGRYENVSSHSLFDVPDISEPEQVCRALPLKEAVMETSDIYPKLNFNVSSDSEHSFKFIIWLNPKMHTDQFEIIFFA